MQVPTDLNYDQIKKLERAAGREASKKIDAALKNAISSKLTTRTGATDTATVTPKFRQDRLDRVTISAPRNLFVQHYGYNVTKDTPARVRSKKVTVQDYTRQDGTRVQQYTRDTANRRGAKMEPKDIITAALSSTGAIDELADTIGRLRAEEVTTRIQLYGSR